MTQASLYRRRAKLWLIMAGILSVVWFVVWLSREEQARAIVKEKSSIISELSLPTHIDALNDFAKEVSAPNLDDKVIKDLRGYTDEFKDKRFLLENKGKFTVEIMDVSEQKLITDYLDRRSTDRSRFVYFRYLKDGKERYILTYGVMHSFVEAQGAANSIDFLPPKISRALPVSIDHYLEMIDNYQYESNRQDDVDFEKTEKSESAKPQKKEEPAASEMEETTEQPPDEAPKKSDEKSVNTDKKERQADKTNKTETKKEDKLKEPISRPIDTTDLATPPTIKPTADAKPEILETSPTPPPPIEGVE